MDPYDPMKLSFQLYCDITILFNKRIENSLFVVSIYVNIGEEKDQKVHHPFLNAANLFATHWDKSPILVRNWTFDDTLPNYYFEFSRWKFTFWQKVNWWTKSRVLLQCVLFDAELIKWFFLCVVRPLDVL